MSVHAEVASDGHAELAFPAGSVCYSGNLLVRNFGYPYEVDRLVMEQGYPWLDTYVQPGCPPVNASAGTGSVSSQ